MVRVVAECGQCHNGSVKTALKMVEAAAQAGAWGVKFQFLQPDTIARADAPKYWTDDIGTTNQRDAFATAGVIPYDAWHDVKAACDTFDVEFLATPFDLAAVDALCELECSYVKVASGDITYKQLLAKIATTGMHAILSTGAATRVEIAKAIAWLLPTKTTLLACTLAYPTRREDANLARILTLRDTFTRPVGYSDHTSLPDTAMVAAAMGAELLEVHFTLDNAQGGVPDHKLAVNPDRLAAYILAAGKGASMRGPGLLVTEPAEDAARMGARRSVCAASDLAAGHELTDDDFVFLRPGDGLPPRAAEQLVGVTIREPVKAGQPIVWP